MSLEVKDIPSKITPVLIWLKKYVVFIFAMVVLLVYGYIIFHINTLASQEPA
jgi:hypothetical protein